jgi:hypothetical protein
LPWWRVAPTDTQDLQSEDGLVVVVGDVFRRFWNSRYSSMVMKVCGILLTVTTLAP